MATTYYDTYWSAKGFLPDDPMPAPLAEIYARHLPRGGRVLDYGCGDGRTSGLWLREHGYGYLGADVSAAAVARAADRGLEAVAIDPGSGAVPVADATFDAVVCTEVLEHLFDPVQALTEMRRVMRPGAVLVVTVPNAVYWRRRLDFALLGRWNPLGDDRSVEEPWRDPHIRFFSPRTLGRLIECVGFDLVELGGHGGTIVGEIPRLRVVCRRFGGHVADWRTHPAYAPLERVAPSLFGFRLHLVARS